VRYSDLFQNAVKRLNSPEQAADIQLLLQKAFNLTATDYWIHKNDTIHNSNGVRKFRRYLDRLERHEPIAHIFNEKEFYSRPFYVNKNVLVPRPETELLVEEAASVLSLPARVLDIGAGSGVISITLALETGATVMALEKSPKAYYVLKKNIAEHNAGSLVIPMKGDLFPRKRERGFDMVVSNPPYLAAHEWEDLSPNVKYYDPKEALVSGESGLEIIEAIIAGAPSVLKSGGHLLMEIGYRQKQAVEELLQKGHYRDIRFVDDYSGIPRIAVACWKG
jgi:release factor glutamine methyltransferase